MESVLAVSYMLAFLWVPILCQKWPKNDFVKPIGAYLRDITFSFQAILSGTQWFSCETTGECDCIALLQRSSVCVVVLSNEACLPSSRVSAIQTPAPRWQPQSSGSFSVLLTRHLKRPVPFTALPSFFSHSHIYVAENGMNLFFPALSTVPRYRLHQAHAGWSCLPSQ